MRSHTITIVNAGSSEFFIITNGGDSLAAWELSDIQKDAKNIKKDFVKSKFVDATKSIIYEEALFSSRPGWQPSPSLDNPKIFELFYQFKMDESNIVTMRSLKLEKAYYDDFMPFVEGGAIHETDIPAISRAITFLLTHETHFHY